MNLKCYMVVKINQPHFQLKYYCILTSCLTLYVDRGKII